MPSTKVPLYKADFAGHTADTNSASLAEHAPADTNSAGLAGLPPAGLAGDAPADTNSAGLEEHHPIDLAHAGIVTVEEAAKHLSTARSQGKTIVFTNGCFDILHPGHVDLLARAKALGDILILGLNTDASVQRLNKGPKRPINTYAARAFLAIHLESVDFVTYFDEDTPLELITRLMPDMLVKGGDWALETIIGHELVLARGGKVYSLPLLGQYSTTNLVHRLQDMHGKA